MRLREGNVKKEGYFPLLLSLLDRCVTVVISQDKLVSTKNTFMRQRELRIFHRKKSKTIMRSVGSAAEKGARRVCGWKKNKKNLG